MLAQMVRVLWKLILACLLVGFVGLATFYIVDGHPLPETTAFLQGDGYATARQPDGGWLFEPEQPNGRGLLIMHGALIKPRSYTKTAAFFAARGYTVLLPYGGATRLPIAALNRTGEALRALDINEWFSIGHSLGGMASLEIIRRNPDLPFSAAALWAAGIPSDYTELDIPILFLWGDHDDLLPPRRFENGKSRLPPGTTYLTVEGANHKDFAMYGHQFLDGEGQLGWKRQTDLANEKTLTFFDAGAL